MMFLSHIKRDIRHPCFDHCFYFPVANFGARANFEKSALGRAKVRVAIFKNSWQYSKIAQNARARTKLGKIARGKFEKSARAPPKNARGKL